MKKIFAILLVAAMLVAMLAVMAVPASAAGVSIAVNAFNPEAMASGVSAIFTQPYAIDGYQENIAFAPVSGNTYEVVAMSGYDWNETDGDILATALEIPLDGFVWCIQWSSAVEIDAACVIANNIKVGETYEVEGLDLEAGTYNDVTLEGPATGGVTSPEAPAVSDKYDTTGNIALGKDYEGFGFSCGGEWPANYTADLTDGKANQAVTFDSSWFAFCKSEGDNGLNVIDGVGTVTIDLGKAYNVSAVKVNLAAGATADENISGAGIYTPASIVAYGAGADGNFTKLGELTVGKANATNVAWATLNADANAQYIKVEFTLNADSTFAFINEIAVIEGNKTSDEPVNPPVDEPSDEPSVEPSEPEASEPETSEPEVDVPTKVGNIALNKNYDGKGYAAGGEWPADYTAKLTDGVAANELTFDNSWFAFCTSEGDNGLNAPEGVGTIIIDLEKVSDIYGVRVNTIFGENVDGSGINGPAKITAYVSDTKNGEYTLLGDLTSDAKEGVAWAELDCNGKGRFVKVEITLNGIFAFINEIEVLGAVEGSADAPTADQPTADQPGKNPSAGDNSNMIFFAIIALMAAAGSAVVVKTRK